MTTKQDLYWQGRKLCEKFCEENDIEDPDYTIVSNRTRNGNSGRYIIHSMELIVWVENCAAPVTNPGNRRWSYPGYKTDRTPYGVICHELGHHVWCDMVGHPEMQRMWAAKARATKKVSSYEPSKEESFAETMRLFLTNPDLLRRAFYPRWEYLTAGLELIPAETRDYLEVLADAPEGIINAARKLVREAA